VWPELHTDIKYALIFLPVHLTSYTKFLLAPLCSTSSQIVTSNLEACNHAGLPYIIGQLPSFSTEASARDQLLRLPV